jgi:hypothetical protein
MKRDLSHGLKAIDFPPEPIVKGGQGRTASEVERSGSLMGWVALGLAFTAGLILGAVL